MDSRFYATASVALALAGVFGSGLPDMPLRLPPSLSAVSPTTAPMQGSGPFKPSPGTDYSHAMSVDHSDGLADHKSIAESLSYNSTTRIKGAGEEI